MSQLLTYNKNKTKQNEDEELKYEYWDKWLTQKIGGECPLHGS